MRTCVCTLAGTKACENCRNNGGSAKQISITSGYDELMSLRGENTKLKLVLKGILEDLEKESERGVPIIIQQEYVDWIKSNVDLRLNSEKKKLKEKLRK